MLRICSLHLGMVASRVTLSVIFTLTLASAHSVPRDDLIKLLSSKSFHDFSRLHRPQLGSLDPAFSISVSMDTDGSSWSPPGLRKEGGVEGSRSPSQWNEDPRTLGIDGEDELNQGSEVKRFIPNAFFGSRGKRKDAALNLDDFMKDQGRDPSLDERLLKRLQAGFLGSRGKRTSAEDGGSGAEWSDTQDKRFEPSGFSGSRGKRYLPGLETLLLSQVYRKHYLRSLQSLQNSGIDRYTKELFNPLSAGGLLWAMLSAWPTGAPRNSRVDAEKWKRQSMWGFHAARG